MTMGNRIAEHRKRLGITQEALAKQLNVSNQAVSKWESDQCCPDIQLLPEIADIFGITLDELFGRQAQTQPAGQSVEGLPWRDDDTLRVVMYLGRQLVASCQARQGFTCTYPARVWEVLSVVSVQCGDVDGDVICAESVTCGNVGGDVDAGSYVNCQTVDGNVDAGTDINCGSIGGDADAGKDITCGNVGGDVDAGSNVACGDVGGDVDAGGSVACGNVDGDVDAGGSVECTKIAGDVDAGGNVILKHG